MKTINVTFEDDEYKTLIKAKKELNWRNFIIRSALNKEIKKDDIEKKSD